MFGGKKKVKVDITFNRLAEIKGRNRTLAGQAVARAAHAIERNAKENIREHDLIDTGDMLNSVQAEKTEAFNWVVYVGVEYGIYHELGTRKLPAKPFFSPAIEAVKPQFFKELTDLIGES